MHAVLEASDLIQDVESSTAAQHLISNCPALMGQCSCNSRRDGGLNSLQWQMHEASTATGLENASKPLIGGLVSMHGMLRLLDQLVPCDLCP